MSYPHELDFDFNRLKPWQRATFFSTIGTEWTEEMWKNSERWQIKQRISNYREKITDCLQEIKELKKELKELNTI